MLGETITDWNSRMHFNANKNDEGEATIDTLSQRDPEDMDVSIKVPQNFEHFVGTYYNPAYGTIVITIVKN